jgi:outer membrane lipoprotein-sorting protein
MAALSVAILLSAISPAHAFGAPTELGDPLGPEESELLLKRLEELQAGFDAISARAIQHKRLAILDEEVKTDGHVILKKPALMRWEVLTPERIIATSDGDVMVVYHVALKQARRIDLSTDFSAKQTMRFFSSVMTSSFDGFAKDFNLSVFQTPDDIIISLSPKSSLLSKYLGSVVIWFGKLSGVPERFTVDWKKRGTIETIFEDIEINPVIDEGLFTLEIPKGVFIIESGLKDDEIE